MAQRSPVITFDRVGQAERTTRRQSPQAIRESLRSVAIPVLLHERHHVLVGIECNIERTVAKLPTGSELLRRFDQLR